MIIWKSWFQQTDGQTWYPYTHKWYKYTHKWNKTKNKYLNRKTGQSTYTIILQKNTKITNKHLKEELNLNISECELR